MKKLNLCFILLLASIIGWISSTAFASTQTKEISQTNSLITIKRRLVNTQLSSTAPTEESLKAYPPKTELSKKALNLKLGMTKTEVLELLETPPTWANEDRGESLVWIWQNGICNPVEVTFNHDMTVSGFDEGRAECLTKAYFALPDDKYICKHLDRQKSCKVPKLSSNLA